MSIVFKDGDQYMASAGVYVATACTVVAVAMVGLLVATPSAATGADLFRCPGVPVVPCLAMFFNWLLFVQML